MLKILMAVGSTCLGALIGVANPVYTWTGAAGPQTSGDWAGFYSWSDPNNWDENGVPQAGAPGGATANGLDFSAAVRDAKIVVDNDIKMHLGGMTFAADQGTIQIVPTGATARNLSTFTSGTITVPAGTRVAFGLNGGTPNLFERALLDFNGAGTFAFTGALSADRWTFNVHETATLELAAPTADFGTVRIALKAADATLRLGCDTAIGALVAAEIDTEPCGAVDLNGYTLTLSGGNDSQASSTSSRLCDITGTGAVVVSGGNVSTNGVASTFAGSLTLRNANLVSEASWTGLTNLSVAGSGRLTVAADQTVGALVGDGTTGGVAIEKGATFTVDGAAQTTYRATLTGEGAFVKSGTGELVLAGTDTRTGETVVRGGTLRVVGTASPSTASTETFHAFSFDAQNADGSFADGGTSAASAKFTYATTSSNDSETPAEGATASEVCAGRRGTSGVRLFAGSRASVYVTPSSGHNGIETKDGPFTMSAWMKLDEAGCRSAAVNSGTHAIFFLGSGMNTELISFKVYLCDGTNLNFSAGGYRTGRASENYPTQGFTVPMTATQLFDGDWHLLSVTYSGEATRTITGYYDGRAAGALTLTGDDAVNLSGRCHLGWGGMGSIAGDFDDWTLLSRCQTAEEVEAAYMGRVTEAADAFAALPAPVAHWAFDEAEHPGKDSSANGNDLTADAQIRTTTPIVDVPGACGKALAASNAYTWAGSSWPEKVPSGNAAWTLSVRCALSELVEDGAHTHPSAFYFGEARQGDSTDYTENMNKFMLVQYDNANYRANRLGLHWLAPKYRAPNYLLPDETYQPRFTSANWVHLTVIHTPGIGFAIYRDGAFVAEQRCMDFNLTAKELFVGLRPRLGVDALGEPYFPGFIDDIAIWDVPLTADQVHAYAVGLATGTVGSPLSPTSDVTVEAGGTLAVDGTCVAAKSLNGAGTVVLSEQASLTVGGGTLEGPLTGCGQLTLTGRLVAKNASTYYGNVVLKDGGALDAADFATLLTVPEGYSTVVCAAGEGLPIVRTKGVVTLPESLSLTFAELPETKTDFVIAEAGILNLPSSFDGWTLAFARSARTRLFVSDGKLMVRVVPKRGMLMIVK